MKIFGSDKFLGGGVVGGFSESLALFGGTSNGLISIYEGHSKSFDVRIFRVTIQCYNSILK